MDNANVGAEISTKQVTELPLNLRNVFNFVQLNSSVNNNSQQQILQSGGEQGTADQDVSFFNFGGGFFGTTAFLLDGAWDSIGSWGGVIYVPSPDNVQEFKVQQNSFTAQYGWSTGNVINVVTKSGGSSLHGVAYDYLRNAASSTPTPIPTTLTVSRSRIRTAINLGLRLGGPVYIPGLYKQRDKTFFFFNYEGHRQNDPLNATLDTCRLRLFELAISPRCWVRNLERMLCAGRFWQGRFMIRTLRARSMPPALYLTLTRRKRSRWGNLYGFAILSRETIWRTAVNGH